MFILYLVIFFFIIIFNVLIPNIVERLQIEDQIFSSSLGKTLTSLTCKNGYWFIIDKNVTGLSLKYLQNQNGELLSCDQNFNSTYTPITCGENGEFNNRHHPCSVLLTELLFFRINSNVN